MHVHFWFTGRKKVGGTLLLPPKSLRANTADPVWQDPAAVWQGRGFCDATAVLVWAIITTTEDVPMTRRDFTVSALSAAAGMALAGNASDALAAGTAGEGQKPRQDADKKPHIAFVLYEGMTVLDLIGPAEVLGGPQFRVDYVSRSMAPVYAESRADKRLGFMPTATFANVASADIVCVPGTSDPYLQIQQQDMVEWLAAVGQKAQWVTSVCTGSFLLGAAGLLQGYKATSHWTLVDELAWFGALPVQERVVRDRNRVTGAGVTSGIDFGLVLLALVAGEETANIKQLLLEYDPAPPFRSGSPRSASPALVETVRNQYQAHIRENMPYARSSLEAAAQRLGVRR